MIDFTFCIVIFNFDFLILNYTRRTFFGLGPLCGIGVMSLIIMILSP